MRATTVFLLGLIAMTFRPSAQGQEQDKAKEPLRNQVGHVPQANPFNPKREADSDPGLRSGFSGHAKDFLEDQKQFWTSPARARLSDATWLVPLAGVSAGLFATDRQYSASLSKNPNTIHHFKTYSNAGVASLIGGGAALYVFSFPAHNEHWRETGFLAGEAALNSLVAVEAMKYSFRRERPFQSHGSGAFFHGGTSFPSEHSAAAWSIAGVIAHEYPGTLPKLLAYGLASSVSFARVGARQHFPSDVFIGAALGTLIAQSVYTRRHDPELSGGAWELPREFVSEAGAHSPSHMGSPYVPLDSWIYPALERLSALGYIQTMSLGMRPWTRLECARLLGEAAEHQADAPADVQDIYASLSREFASEIDLPEDSENVHAQLESVYQRSLGISGSPLTDGYHFGQTIQNDYGRPFQQGFNTAAGTSVWAAAGPFVVYARGEYQYVPSAPAPSAPVLGFISTADYLPQNAPSVPVATTSRFRALDAYVGMNIANWQLSYGRQSLWWGTSEGGTLAFTNNAEPVNMFRLNRVSPFRLPGLFSLLGDMRLDFFVGQLSGQEFINNGVLGTQAQGQYGKNLRPQPYFSGGKISFKFNENFEFNMSKTTIFGGPGNPFTLKTLAESTFGVHVNGEALGDGRSNVDFSYRIPKLRNWLSVYGEGFTEDEVSPLSKPGKSVWQGGLYAARLPKAPKLDLRVEGGYTSPVDFSVCNGCFYHNFQYVNGFTNNGQLMGTWIGRAAQGETVRSNYWLSSTRRVGIEMRHRKIDRQFLSQGGTQNDIAANADFLLRSGFRLSGTFQYERWQVPLLATGKQSNVTAWLQLSYWPKVHTK